MWTNSEERRDLLVIRYYSRSIFNYLCNPWISPLTLWVRIPLRWSVLNTRLCDQVCQWLATGRWFSPVSSTNKTDLRDIAELVLKVAFNNITHPLYYYSRNNYILNIKHTCTFLDRNQKHNFNSINLHHSRGTEHIMGLFCVIYKIIIWELQNTKKLQDDAIGKRTFYQLEQGCTWILNKHTPYI